MGSIMTIDEVLDPCFLPQDGPEVASTGTKYSVLEPAHDQFAEILTVNITIQETANISSPPGNTAEHHVQSADHLQT